MSGPGDRETFGLCREKLLPGLGRDIGRNETGDRLSCPEIYQVEQECSHRDSSAFGNI